MTKKTNYEFINQSKNIYGDKYDYSLVNYINNVTKIKIICTEHGVFEQTPHNFLKGHSCKKCNSLLKTTEQFIKDAKKIHNDKYDYSLVEYKGSFSKIKIICEKHGVFEQTPSDHLKTRGCKCCAIEKNIKIKSKTTEQFIKDAKKIHGDKYDYSLVDYVNCQTKVKIICTSHGIFEQSPNNHLLYNGCPKCSHDKQRSSLYYFLIRSKQIHGNKYDYSLVDYINYNTNIKIICKKHGIFKQSPHNHLQNKGCPICNQSKGEKLIKYILDKNNIIYETQKKFIGCKDKGLLKFDFYLPSYNTCIEFDGKQHYEPIKHFGGEKSYNDLKIKDNIKNKYCENNNINLIRIKYNENIKNIKNIIHLLN